MHTDGFHLLCELEPAPPPPPTPVGIPGGRTGDTPDPGVALLQGEGLALLLTHRADALVS